MLLKSVMSNRFWLILMIVGTITLIFSGLTYKNVASSPHNIAMFNGMFFGLGLAFTIISLFKLIQNRITPPKKLKIKEIEQKDERNIKILQISYSIASIGAIILFVIMAFVFVRLNYIVPALISIGSMYIQVSIFFISYKYYNDKI